MRISYWFAALLSINLLGFHTPVRASGEACGDNHQTLGKLTVSPAKVAGLPLQRLELRPELLPPGAHSQKNDKPGPYLITGDQVDLVRTCEDSAYVRFHGTNKVSTGWVDRSRIVVTGRPHVPLPPDANEICSAAEATLNAGEGGLKRIYMPGLFTHEDVEARIAADTQDDLWPSDAITIAVNGHRMKAVEATNRGTCLTSQIRLWMDDLSSSLTPADFEYRIPSTDDYHFSGTQELVEVDGRTMILTESNAIPQFLSTIDRDGDIQPTCRIERISIAKPATLIGQGNRMCRAVASDAVEHVVFHEPKVDPSEASITEGQKASLVDNARSESGPMTEGASLDRIGLADIDNSGVVRPVGIIEAFRNSTAGCGESYVGFYPVVLRGDGHADLQDPLNKRLMKELSWFPDETRIIKFDGVTYIDMRHKTDDQSWEVWKLAGGKITEMCSYQMTKFRVSVVADGVGPSGTP